MDKDEILQEIKKALALNSESDLVEFKKAKGGFPKKEVKKTLSAFGNTEGGLIVFGVEEKEDKKLKVIGVKNIAELQEKMTNLSARDMNKVLRLEYFSFEIDEKIILAVYVPKCENHFKPYYIKEIGLPHGAYVRDGNTDRRMTEDEMKNYVRNAQGDDFDGKCAEDINIEELSSEKIERFLQKSAQKTDRDFDVDEPREDILQNIGIVKKCDGKLRPTVAGYLIFAEGKPQNKINFERYKIRCVRYKGSGVHTDILDKADIVGTLDEQIDSMQVFVLRNIRKSADIDRDYRITETYTQVNVFEDRIEVFNPGNLPPGVTVENIKTAQVSRNKIIAGRLNEMDYLEEYGRGIDIVFTKMKEWKLLPPIFKNTSNSFRVILPGINLSKLNKRQIEIWEYLSENSRITRKEAEVLVKNTPQQTISYDLRKMMDLGLIKKVGDSRDTFYEASF